MLVPGIVAALHGHIICGSSMAHLSCEERCKLDQGVPGQCWSVKGSCDVLARLLHASWASFRGTIDCLPTRTVEEPTWPHSQTRNAPTWCGKWFASTHTHAHTLAQPGSHSLQSASQVLALTGLDAAN